MHESIIDIETLTLKCHSDQSKIYIQDSILCYKSGAYRASIVSTWIALVFDLIDKMRELSIKGEAEAKVYYSQVETYVTQIESHNNQGFKSALEFERDILNICRDKLSFFTTQQFIDLDRLREDRHRCAHPSFQRLGEPYTPSAEQARLHLRNVVIHVLSEPPIQGKSAIKDIVAQITSQYFPKDTDKAVVQLKNSALQKPTPGLINGVIDNLIHGYIESTNTGMYMRKQTIAALNALIKMYPNESEKRIRKELNKITSTTHDDKLLPIASMVVRMSIGWRVLEIPARDKIKSFIINCRSSDVTKGIKAIYQIDDLKLVIMDKIKSFKIDDVALAIEQGEINHLLKDRCIELLSESRSWIGTNSIIDRIINPVFNFLNKEDFEKIIKLPKTHDADLPGASSYSSLVNKIRSENKIQTTDLDILLKDNNADFLVPKIVISDHSQAADSTVNP